MIFRQKLLQKLAKNSRLKKKDESKRKRNKCVNFRLTEEENQILNKKIELSGLLKQEYILNCLLNYEVKMAQDYKLYDRLSKEIFQFAKVIKKYGKLEEPDQEILLFILEIYEALKQEKAPK
ncbi:MAG: plasmid mobilization protein [Erysipelotrichaceae bacterium]|jgi:predicted DNA binding CopG/RHH family protein